MGIVHGEASYLPDFLDYFSTKFPSAPVKMEILGKKDIETTTMVNFYSQVSWTKHQLKESTLFCAASHISHLKNGFMHVIHTVSLSDEKVCPVENQMKIQEVLIESAHCRWSAKWKR